MRHVRMSFLLALFVSCLAFSAGILAQTPPVTMIGSDRLVFEETGAKVENGEVAFASTVSGLKFQFYPKQASIDIEPDGVDGSKPFHLSLAGANPAPQLIPEGKLPGIANYFPSSDVRTWRTNLRTWSALHYQDIYPGIDLVYYGNRGQLEYDFVVAPGHDPQNIALEIAGAKYVTIGRDGCLDISDGINSFRFSKPVIYQRKADGSRVDIAGGYVTKSEGRIAFDIPTWDRDLPLIIDPALVYSEFVGVSGESYMASAIDLSGAIYLAGRSGGGLVVEKISADGTTVLYHDVISSTPSYNATPQDIRIDSAGNAYVVGVAGVNFPTTSNAFLQSVSAGNHAFLAVLNAAGNGLTYATYLADTTVGKTTGFDQANGVALDSTNKVYLTGFTSSGHFPTTTGVVQTKNPNTVQMGFVAKFDPTKSGAASLVYSTYLGGLISTTTENGIAVDSSGNAYVTGNGGPDFPVTPGAFSYNGEALGQGGVYVTKLNSAATALSYSAYLGAGTANGIAVDGNGDAYVAGNVGIEDFPTTSGAYQTTFPAGFSTELNTTGSALVYSTFLSGPSELINPTDIALQPGCASACSAAIVGFTGGNDLPTTNPIQGFNASYVNGATGNDAFVTELNGTGTAAVYSTYLGGASDESTESSAHSPSVAVNSTGDVFVLGQTTSGDFPVTLTTTPFRGNFAARIGATAGSKAVVFPLNLAFSTSQPIGVPGTATTAPGTVTLRNMGSTALTPSISISPSVYTETNNCGTSLAGGSECTITPTFTPTSTASTPGTLTVNGSAVSLTGTGGNQAFLTLSPSSLTFADQNVGTASPSQTVTLGNSATTTLNFSSAPFTTSGPYAFTTTCGATLAHGATCTVNIAFLPTQNGAASGTLQISSTNNSFQALSSVALSGTGFVGSPALTLSASSLVFNTTTVGVKSQSQSVLVTNTGNVPVSIFGVSPSLSDYTVTNCAGQTLNPGGACFLFISFTPTTTGTRTATITLSDSTQQGTPAGTHSLTVTGTGVASTQTLSMTPSTLSFADTAVGATSPSQLVVTTNTGDANVTIDRVFSSTPDFNVKSTGCVTTTFAPGRVCNTSVEFTPTTAGVRTGTLVFNDSATGSPQTVTLSGTGLVAAPAAEASPDSVNFGNQAVGTTSPTAFSVNLTNIGNLPFDASNNSITGTNANDYQISFEGCTSGFLITPGRNCQVQVSFSPTGTGNRIAALTFTNVAGTQTVSLNGTGVTATDALQAIPNTSITFQPQQKSVASPFQTGNIINTGSAAFTVNNIASASSDYSVSNGCSVVQPNTSCQFLITFTPSVNSGADNSTLTITTTPAISVPSIALNGSGATTLPGMQLSPAGLSYSSQVVSTTSTAQSVSVTNNSGSTVTGISVPATAGDFTISNNNCSATLANSSSCSFQVIFKPTVAGVRTTALNITDNLGTQTVNLAGFGVAAASGVRLPQTQFSFPTETVGVPSPGQPSPTQTATFQNTGNTPVTIASVALGGANPGDFSISSSCPISPSVLNAFSSCNTSVTFAPTATGIRNATLVFAYTGAAGSPQSATLTGKGVASVQALEFGPKSINFGTQVDTVQSPLNPSVLLTNTGTAPVTISNLALSGPNASDFALSNGCPGTLQQGPLSNTCTVGVTFTPSATGARTATLTITHSAPGSPANITLSGTGVAQTKTLVVTPSSLAFNQQVVGTTSTTQNITVANIGNFNVTFTGVTVTGNFGLPSNNCIGTLGPASACTIQVDFTPTGTTGSKAGTVSIADNATGNPQKVTVAGTAISTSTEIQLSQTTVTFDAQTVATQSNPQIVYYSNQGNTAQTISTIALGGANASDYSLTGSSCANGGAVSAGFFCTIMIRFTPAAAGTRTATITITDTAPGSPRLITLSGTGITSAAPEVNLTPGSVAFGNQFLGTTSNPQNINLTNNGQAPLSLTGISVTGTNPGDFAQANNCPLTPNTLPAGFSCNIAVTFSPTALGARSANISVNDNAVRPKFRSLPATSPQTVSLTGNGKSGAIVTLTPPSLSFPNVALGTPSQRQVTLKNTGAAPLTITNIGVTGTVSSDFSQSTNCPISPNTLAVNSSCTITVTFTPTTTENQTGTVSITDNAPNSPQTVPITANGAEPAVLLSPNPLSFPSTTVGGTSTLTLNLENYGNAPLTISSIVTDNSVFTIGSNNCGSSVSPGVTCQIQVQFKPTATGSATGDLTIQDNAGDSPQTIELSGTGT